MTYGSICSGIEAATVAWHSLGWTPAWFSEIDPFANSVLKHHYPGVPNLGDMTKLHETETFRNTKLDLLVGGTPCQSFSQAGLRRAFDDPRGDLALKFIRLIDIAKPTWILWENVTGVLSADRGRAFAEFTHQIRECGYGFSYRVLDAQCFGVPQKRRRVYLVGHRDYRCAASVLFEPEVLCGSSSAYDFEKEKSAIVGESSGESSEQKVFGVDIYNYADTGNIAATFGANSGATNSHGPKLIDGGRLRKFTPIEVERLMGFADDYTLVPYKGKPAIDSWRWKALGNSMVIPVMSWIGQRIDVAHKGQFVKG